MEAWLIPISLFTKRYLSVNTLAIFPLAMYVCFLLYLFFSKRNSLKTLKISKGMLFFTLLFLASQTAVVFFTYHKIQNDPASPNLFSGVFFGIYLLTLNIVIIAMLIRSLIREADNVIRFYRGFYIALFIYGLLVLVPQLLFVLFHFSESWINLVAKLFEEQHPGRTDFYFNGSYTTTLKRINGFCSEASFLAAQLGIVFIPVILSSIKNKVNLIGINFKHPQLVNWFFLLFIWLILLFAKTSTGFLVIFVSLIIIFFASNISQKVIYTILGIVGIIFIVGSYFFIAPIREIMNNYLLHKSGVSNRLGGTIGLIMIFLHYPFLGVGTGYESYYLMKYVPVTTTNNWEFQNVFLKSGYPVQSILPDFFARYGLIIMLPIIVYILIKIIDAHDVKKQLIGTVNLDNQELVWIATIDAFYYFLTMFFVVSLFSFGWYNSYYIVMFFFYMNVIKVKKRKLAKK